ncbi:MAG: DUF6089 family protein [Spirosomaceae bacterium]|nr:DUF6089 family protein [Spirosomataceae bacterium]
MKKTLSIIFVIASLSSSIAQKFEIGGGAGFCHYKGDLAPSFKPFQARPGGNLFFRYNHSRAVSAKVSGLFGQISAKDANVSKDLFLQKRDWEFKKTFFEGAAQIEYNFLNFRTTSSRIVNNWTPYVFGGGVYMMSANFAQSWGGVSIGLGIKKQWNNKWNWGIEFGSRKVFDADFLDGYGFYIKDVNTSGIVKGTPNFPATTTMQGDMYYYTNFSISYVFYKVHCPPGR